MKSHYLSTEDQSKGLNSPNYFIIFIIITVYVLSLVIVDVQADDTPAFDVVLKADTKRLNLLEQVSFGISVSIISPALWPNLVGMAASNQAYYFLL